MNRPTIGELQEARRPIVSLIGKLEKSERKLTPGTWQLAMLRANLKALRIASLLMDETTSDTNRLTSDDLREALSAFASMINRTEHAHTKSSPATSQYSLLRNRLKALRIAEALTMAELEKRSV